MAVHQEVFGILADGRTAHCFTLTNSQGLRARVTNYGAILISMETPDARGTLADLTLGFETLEEWESSNTPYYGATVGRFGNRIAHGRFTLDGQPYELATNNAPGGIPCALHGGIEGFSKKLWNFRLLEGAGVEFSYTSADGEEGFPGNLTVKVTYTLNDANELEWKATATTDAPTVVNLIHHSYWNLSGDPTTTITDHILTLNASRYLPTDPGLIPTGSIAPVAGTPMDFTRPTVIGERIDSDFEPLEFGNGYDHCWVVDGNGLRLAARLQDPKSGRAMEVWTDQPSVQFYAGNFLDDTVPGKRGLRYRKRAGMCLETEGFPDAPNQPTFPSSVLRPGQLYTHTMIHRFSAE